MIELPTERTSASYFSALGIRPLIGRFYDAAESDAAPGANVVVLGYDFWRRQFASDPGVIGHSITLAGSPFTVIGVAPRGFAGLSPSVVDAWVPITAGVTASDFQSKATSRQSYWMFVLARLRPGVTVAAAADRATASIRAGEAAEGESASDIAAEAPTALLRTALPRDANADSPDAKVAVLVAGVSFLLLLLACANVANLQLARAIRRRHELAVRLALGVSRRRLLAQLMLDGLLLAVFGGAGALAFVVWGGAIIRRELLATRSADMPLDLRVLGYSAVAALLTAVLTGFVPALRASRLDLTNDLKAGGRNTSARRSRVRLGLIAAQAMLAT